MSSHLMSVTEVKERTREALKSLLPPGERRDVEIDFSYITEDLLAAYRNDANEKDGDACKAGILENVACYWGNNWVHETGNTWLYTNNHSGTGCDPVTESCLCGSGYRWRVRVNTMSQRYCANASQAYMAWP